MNDHFGSATIETGKCLPLLPFRGFQGNLTGSSILPLVTRKTRGAASNKTLQMQNRRVPNDLPSPAFDHT